MIFSFFFSFLLLAIPCYSTEILGIGSPCIDILVHVEDAFLEHVPGEKGGSQRLDWPYFNKVLEKGLHKNPHFMAGGSCANTLKGLSGLGQKTRLFGKLGEDGMGAFFLEQIAPLLITPHFLFSDTPTTQVLCLVTPDKNRTMRVFIGAGDELTEADLYPEVFEGASHLHLEGYALYNGQLVEEATKMAKEQGITVSFDLGCFELVKLYKERILSLIPSCDIVFANSDEAHALFSEEPETACSHLGALCPIAVVLVGKDGCFVSSKGNTFHVPTSPCDVVDTTGAGDFFASGFLYQFIRGKSLLECAKMGNLLGSLVVTFEGGEIPEKDFQKLREQTGL